MSVTNVEKRSSSDLVVRDEAARRRTFAVISHPDAGKSTLTEALALHAAAINSAGAVHGKAGRRGVTSDWMSMEKDRDLDHLGGAQVRLRRARAQPARHARPRGFLRGHLPGARGRGLRDHAADSAKGLEPQTLKLFDVCRSRHVPVVTFVNKWDRPGREPLELLDEIEQRIGLRPTPLNWPVGIAGTSAGWSSAPPACTRPTRGRRAAPGRPWRKCSRTRTRPASAKARPTTPRLRSLSCSIEIGADIDMESFLAGESSPVLFGAALSNIGVRRLLDAMCELAPAPTPRASVEGDARPVAAPFSGLVFKVQANMDPAHRDRVAFVRVASGRFERGMVLTHAATGRPFATKYAQAMFGQERETVETAYPGDVIGLVNAGALRPGDTLYTGVPVAFPPIPSFAPEHFGVVRCKDAGKYKQFRRGIDQLDTEGVVQVLASDLRGDQAPVLAAVGPLQFDVVLHRLEHEFGARSELDTLGYEMARLTDEDGVTALAGVRGAEVLTRRLDGALLRAVRRQVAAERDQAGQPDPQARPAAGRHRGVDADRTRTGRGPDAG